MKKLTIEQHMLVATLLNQANDNLIAASEIVNTARFTDVVLGIAGVIQIDLMDKMRADLDKLYAVDVYINKQELYQNIGYPSERAKVIKILGRGRRKKAQDALRSPGTRH